MARKTTRFGIPFLWSLALIAALVYAPTPAEAGCTIRCKTCIIDHEAGTSTCTDCTFECGPDDEEGEN